MPVDDFLTSASLPDVSVDTEGALARTRQVGDRRKRRRVVMAGAGVVFALAATAGAGLQLAAGDDGSPELVTTDDPTTSDPPDDTSPPTTEPTTSTAPTTTSTTPPASTDSSDPSTEAPAGPQPSTDCTREAVAASAGWEVDEVMSDPVCNAGWGWVNVCPASEESTEGCIHVGKIIRVEGDQWTYVGALLQDCAENFTQYGAPQEVAEHFYPRCF